MEFVSILLICDTEGCPSQGFEKWALMRLDDHGCLPWVACGVCGLDIIPDPHPVDELV